MTKPVNLSLTDEGTAYLTELSKTYSLTRSEFVEALIRGLTDTSIKNAIESGLQLRRGDMKQNRRSRSQQRKAAYIMVQAMTPEQVAELLATEKK